LAYALTRAAGSRWQSRRLDQKTAVAFDTHEAAFAAMRRAVVRCAAYPFWPKVVMAPPKYNF